MERGMMLHHNPMVPHSAPSAGSPGPHRSPKTHHGFAKTHTGHMVHKPFTPSTSPLAKEEKSSSSGSPVVSRAGPRAGPNSPSISSRGAQAGSSSPIVRTSPSGRGTQTWVTHPGSAAAQKPTTLYPQAVLRSPSPSDTAASSAQQRGNTKESNKPRKSKGKPMHLWGNEDVTKWLRRHGHMFYTLYVDLFKSHEITGRSLLRLTDWKLLKMGIMEASHREELMRIIFKQKLKADSHDMKTLEQKASPSPFLRK